MRSILDVVEGWYLGAIIHVLHSRGVLSMLERPCTSLAVARRMGWERRKTEASLRFVSIFSDILIHQADGRYRLSDRYRGTNASFQLAKHLGGYGPTFTSLESSLRHPGTRHGARNAPLFAAAFSNVPRDSVSDLAAMIVKRGATAVVEIGAGSAPVLREACRLSPAVHGFAIERSRHLCRAARRLAAESGIQHRISVIQGSMRSVLNGRVSVHGADAICLRGVMNEFFWHGDTDCVRTLRALNARFPGRLVFVNDYYGNLQSGTADRGARKGLLQDLVQVLTGQGVPPGDLRHWRRIYEAAGVTLVDQREQDLGGARGFTHVLRLGGVARKRQRTGRGARTA